jgi:hypothetical protein
MGMFDEKSRGKKSWDTVPLAITKVHFSKSIFIYDLKLVFTEWKKKKIL